MFQRFAVWLCLAAPLAAQPSINANGVVSAASYAGPLAQGAQVQIAQGSIAVIFGKNLGPAALAQAAALPLTTQLAGTEVDITWGANGTGFGWMLYTSAGQVSFILPSAVPVGPATVTVKYNGAASNGVKIQVVKTAFGFFTRNGQGTGPVVAQNYVSPTSLPTNGLAAAGQPGQTLILYGTGLGPVSALDNNAPGAATIPVDLTIYLGGVALTPSYVGRNPAFPGLDQINFTLPPSFSADVKTAGPPAAGPGGSLAGCYVSMTVDITGAMPSNQVTVSLARPGQADCPDPFGFDIATKQTLDNGGTVVFGLMEMARFYLGYLGLPGISYVDAAGGGFVRGNSDTAYQLSQNQGNPYPWIKPGQCIVIDPVAGTVQNSQALQLPAAAPNFQVTQIVNAGTSWTLSGPGVTMPLNKQANGGYATNGTNTFLTGGTWTISSSGGNTANGDVGPFSVPITLAANAPPNWTNAANYDAKVLLLPPAGGAPAITFTWKPFGDPNNPNFVGVEGSSANYKIDLLGGNFGIDGKTFQCVALSTDGTFTVPPDVVGKLPTAPHGTQPGLAFVPTSLGFYAGTLGFASGDITLMPKISGVAGGAIGWGVVDARNVVWSDGK